MGSYGVIKEALLVKEDTSGNVTIVQKLVPSTVNGVVVNPSSDDYLFEAQAAGVASVNRGGAFSNDDINALPPGENNRLIILVHVPGYGNNRFEGTTSPQMVEDLGNYIKLTPVKIPENVPYTHLYLHVENVTNVFGV